MERSSPIYKTKRAVQYLIYYVLPHEALSKIYYRIRVHKKLDIKAPKTLNEKLQWLKLYHYPNNPLVVQCCDKYTVRDYVKEKGLGDKLTHLLGVWDDAREIDWDALPNQFVLKCTHGCAYNIVCSDKKALDKKRAAKRLNQWLKQNFAAFNVEPQYEKIKHRRIIAEEFLGDKLMEYKFFCFNGKPLFLYASMRMNFDDKHSRLSYFDMHGEKLSMTRRGYQDVEMGTLPDFFDEMKDAAALLAKDFIFARVDFFGVGKSYVFAELTFTPGGAMMAFNPPEYDLRWGRALDISKIFNEYSQKKALDS